jgi:hypothetical protein
VSETPAFAPQRSARRSAAPAPLDVWRRAVLFALGIMFLAGASAAYLRTPMPSKVDSEVFEERFASLDQQAAAMIRDGKRPLRVVLVGTSRFRNAGQDAAAMTRAAKAAGIERPVASAVIGINWGGFERILPIESMIKAHKIDAVVLMPELLEVDLNRMTRAKFGLAWLRAIIRGEPYAIYTREETTREVCTGYEMTPADRQVEFAGMVTMDRTGAGPQVGRAFVRRVADSGVPVLVADVPVSKALSALRAPEMTGEQFLATHGLSGHPQIRPRYIGVPLRQQDYCDYAHLDPKKADGWRNALFRRIAGDLAAVK